MKNRRYQLYGLLFGLVLLLFVFYAFRQYTSSREAAIQAAVDLQTSQNLASRIESLKQLPAQAGLRQVAKGELDKQMELSAQQAGISNIVAITPELPRRVASTVYMEQSTGVLLKQVTMAQVVDFLYTLCSKTTGLRVSSLRFSVPRESDAGGRWTAQIAVSYRYYAPQNTPARGEP